MKVQLRRNLLPKNSPGLIRIKNGQKKAFSGNLYQRDWGYASDCVEAMWTMQTKT